MRWPDGQGLEAKGRCGRSEQPRRTCGRRRGPRGPPIPGDRKRLKCRRHLGAPLQGSQVLFAGQAAPHTVDTRVLVGASGRAVRTAAHDPGVRRPRIPLSRPRARAAPGLRPSRPWRFRPLSPFLQRAEIAPRIAPRRRSRPRGGATGGRNAQRWAWRPVRDHAGRRAPARSAGAGAGRGRSCTAGTRARIARGGRSSGGIPSPGRRHPEAPGGGQVRVGPVGNGPGGGNGPVDELPGRDRLGYSIDGSRGGGSGGAYLSGSSSRAGGASGGFCRHDG